ncbi:MAG TPA: ABC transporter substrate-binding protein [Coriobacteriia bacterium]|nr:ABC transporter substrate-binding protein [Coriobacteriia bacterium]
MTRSSRMLTLIVAVLAIAALVLSGCTAPKADTAKTPATAPTTEAAAPLPIKIGVLPTEDSLPLWVAEQKGYFGKNGLPSVEIVVFQSAQERDAAFASGAIDGFMGDIIAAANLEAGGSPGTILTIMLGADQSQGRFGVVVPPKSKVTKLTELADVPVGTSSATIQEYVLDKLMAEGGVADAKVKKEEVKKVPVRFELLMAGKLKAAALPEPFLSLAEAGGAKVIGDDTKSKSNISQTILFVSDKFLSTPGGTESADAVLKSWDEAVADVNAAPGTFRTMLVEKARLPKPLEKTYKVNTYPTAQVPAQADVDAVLAWMEGKGYLKKDVTFENLTLITPAK